MKKQHGITPAALSAAMSGDLENFLAAYTPGGIEAQEARGQRDLCRSERLPRQLGASREALEKAWGVKFKDDADDLFVNVELPKGWKLEPTEHSVWSHLNDEQGRERAAIFYKAAFYDRNAHMSVTRRFGVRFDYNRSDKEKVGVSHVTDGGKIIFSTEPIPLKQERGWEVSNAANEAAEAWLVAKYPNWQDPFAYWNE